MTRKDTGKSLPQLERNMNKALLGFAIILISGSNAMAADSGVPRTIEVHARRFSFQPDAIHVKKGETVRLRLVSDDIPHSLQVKDLGIDETATRKKPGDATFTAHDSGTFRGQCGRFCGEGHGKMSFTVQVDGD